MPKHPPSFHSVCFGGGKQTASSRHRKRRQRRARPGYSSAARPGSSRFLSLFGKCVCYRSLVGIYPACADCVGREAEPWPGRAVPPHGAGGCWDSAGDGGRAEGGTPCGEAVWGRCPAAILLQYLEPSGAPAMGGYCGVGAAHGASPRPALSHPPGSSGAAAR